MLPLGDKLPELSFIEGPAAAKLGRARNVPLCRHILYRPLGQADDPDRGVDLHALGFGVKGGTRAHGLFANSSRTLA